MFQFHLFKIVIRRYGNLKVGSVFGSFHPNTAVSFLNFKKKLYFFG